MEPDPTWSGPILDYANVIGPGEFSQDDWLEEESELYWDDSADIEMGPLGPELEVEELIVSELRCSWDDSEPLGDIFFSDEESGNLNDSFESLNEVLNRPREDFYHTTTYDVGATVWPSLNDERLQNYSEMDGKNDTEGSVAWPPPWRKNLRGESEVNNQAIGDTEIKVLQPPQCEGEPLAPTNLGYQLLRNMGWNPGFGLGIDGNGIQSPIGASGQKSRGGLGVLTPLQVRNLNMVQPTEQVNTARVEDPGDQNLSYLVELMRKEEIEEEIQMNSGGLQSLVNEVGERGDEKSIELRPDAPLFVPEWEAAKEKSLPHTEKERSDAPSGLDNFRQKQLASVTRALGQVKSQPEGRSSALARLCDSDLGARLREPESSPAARVKDLRTPLGVIEEEPITGEEERGLIALFEKACAGSKKPGGEPMQEVQIEEDPAMAGAASLNIPDLKLGAAGGARPKTKLKGSKPEKDFPWRIIEGDITDPGITTEHDVIINYVDAVSEVGTGVEKRYL